MKTIQLTKSICCCGKKEGGGTCDWIPDNFHVRINVHHYVTGAVYLDETVDAHKIAIYEWQTDTIPGLPHGIYDETGLNVWWDTITLQCNTGADNVIRIIVWLSTFPALNFDIGGITLTSPFGGSYITPSLEIHLLP